MTPTHFAAEGAGRRLGGALAVLVVLAGYYFLLVAEPRAIGAVDPDRYFHLALSKLIAGHGFPDALMQPSDLGWGRYFPDKEFLFHALTGGAYWLAGERGVLALVPLLGLSIFLVLYLECARVLRPAVAAAWVLACAFLTAGFLFRLSLLRPHVLAVLCFCLLVVAVLRARPWLALLSSLAFALAYHAFYVPAIVAALAFFFRVPLGIGRLWAWSLAGVGIGIVLNPYFPGNVAMSLLHLRLALGLSPGEGGQGLELQAFSLANVWRLYGFYFAAVLLVLAAVVVRKPAPGADAARFRFLLVLAVLMLGLGFKSVRAMEYAVPVGILLGAHAAGVLGRRHLLLAQVGLLALIQGSASVGHYRKAWTEGLGGGFGAYAHAISQIPAKARGRKVFNCEWESGAYLFYLRPDLRFVDILEPAFLQAADPFRYRLRGLLVHGAVLRPQRELRRYFNADYVLCASPAMVAQMARDADNFQSLPGTERDPVRLFVVRPGDPAPPPKQAVVPTSDEFHPLEVIKPQ